MAFRHGKTTLVVFEDQDVSQWLNDSSVSDQTDANETTTYGLGAKRYQPGLEDVTVSLGGLFDGDADAIDDIFATALKGDALVHALVVSDSPAARGNRCTFLEAVKTSYEVSNPVADVVTISAELQGSRGAGHGILLADTTPVAASVTPDSVDGGDYVSARMRAHIHVLANTRDGNTTVAVEHSADDVTFAQLGLVTIPAGQTGVFTLDVEDTIQRYLQADIVLAGTTGTITVAAGAARL